MGKAVTAVSDYCRSSGLRVGNRPFGNGHPCKSFSRHHHQSDCHAFPFPRYQGRYFIAAGKHLNELQQKTLFCLHCGESFAPEAEFCSFCGTPRGSSKELSTSRLDSGLKPKLAPTSELNNLAWEKLKPLGAFIGMLFLVLFIAGLFGPRLFTHQLVLWFQLGCLLLTLGYCIAYRNRVLKLLTLQTLSKRGVTLSFASTLGFLFCIYFSFWLLSLIGLPIVDTTQGYQSAGLPPWFIYLSVCILPALWEELAFRGVLQTCLEPVFSKKEALFIQAALFSALHLAPLQLVTHFGLGLLLGWQRMYFRSLYPGILLHFSWNCMVVYGELSRVSNGSLHSM